MCLPLGSLLLSYFCCCSFLLLYIFPSSSAFHQFLLALTPPPLLFPVLRTLSHVLYTVLHFNLLFFDRLPSCTSFQFLIVPELHWPLRSGVSVLFLTSSCHIHPPVPNPPICLDGSLSSLPFPPTVQAALLPLVFFISPSIDSNVFPYRRHFSFFTYYSGVIHSSFLFPRAAT